MIKRFSTLLAVAVLLAAPLAQAGVSKALLDIHERLYQEPDGHGVFADTRIHQPATVSRFYEMAGYEPVWTDAAYARQMLELLASSEAEGLNPRDYHYQQLLALKAEYDQPWSDKDYLHAKAEVLLTDGILLYAHHLHQGKVDPRTLDDSWNYSRRDFDPDEVANSLHEAIAGQRVAQVLEELKPQVNFYRVMKQALSDYRQLAASQAFYRIPDDKVLRRGDQHPNVILLRQRLRQLSLLEDGPDSSHFDAELDAAVQRLQRAHGLAADGIVGRDSYAALNLSFGDRVEILRINLDRLRWMAQDLSDDFVVVNIAGYELYYLRDGALQWETPVMVGAIKTRTPIFHARLKYLEFNPTWNVPRSILGRSLLPRFKADAQYAGSKGYRFLDAKGNPVAPDAIEFNRYTARNFPYRVVQMPGPDNAMGRVKFMFPNRHAVYLHDTPSRSLFSHTERAFSAGCIRVQNPLELARVLLDDPQQWSGAQISALVDSGDPRQMVQMQRPVDVMLMYWTVSPSTDSGVQFHRDIYGLDPVALAALNASF